MFLGIYLQTTMKKDCVRQSFKNSLCFQKYYYLTKQGQDEAAPNAICGQYSSKLKLR